MALGQLGPLGLHQQSHGSFSSKTVDVQQSLTGAASGAQAGPVVASTPSGLRQQLGPWGLPSKVRNFTGKGVNDVTVTLVGASSRLAGEELEGSNVVIRLDGGQIICGAGKIDIPESPTGGWGGVSAYNARQQRKKEREERLKRLRAEIKGLNRWR